MVKFCSECGAKNTGGRFCSECGFRFTDEAAPAAAAAVVAPIAAFAGAASSSATPSAFRSANSPYGGNTYRHDRNSGNGSPPPPPPPPPAPYVRKTVPSAFRGGNSSVSDANPNAPSAIPVASDPVPPAATGAEAQRCYESCVKTIRASRGGNNEHGVKEFKQNCRKFGLKEIDVHTFYASLVTELGGDGTRDFVPTLARLVPDDDSRKELVDYNAQQRAIAYSSGNSGSSSGSSNGGRPSAFANSSCSPVRLLVPPGKQIEAAKGYDPSVPQRVCIQCAPQLHSLQDELVATYAQSHTDNGHEARGRLHVPFTNSLNKECNNAADIIGNFFRDDWGAAADRAIPVAFLQKAHGLAIMTVLKAGFLVSGKIGTGLVVSKLPDGSWSAPSAIGTFGLSGGFELGGELVEVMIILGSEGAVKVFHKPQVNLGAGLDVTVGPYGRSALAAAAASTSGLNANYSYSQSKGLFAGISLQGAIIATRSDLNRKFYGRDLQASELLSGYVEQPNAARPLYEAIDKAMQGIEDHREEQQRRSSVMGPCRLCNCPMFQAHTTQIWNKKCKTCSHAH
ncbi:hypothetical protein BBJ28_00001655 [Nothophytophthora sp. Chile5]|nr:hypothetical protein BBJ28_00001655 [Nothophytophthora sp. Chile5]